MNKHKADILASMLTEQCILKTKELEKAWWKLGPVGQDDYEELVAKAIRKFMKEWKKQ
jgi:hypothetical protein